MAGTTLFTLLAKLGLDADGFHKGLDDAEKATGTRAGAIAGRAGDGVRLDDGQGSFDGHEWRSVEVNPKL